MSGYTDGNRVRLTTSRHGDPAVGAVGTVIQVMGGPDRTGHGPWYRVEWDRPHEWSTRRTSCVRGINIERVES